MTSHRLFSDFGPDPAVSHQAREGCDHHMSCVGFEESSQRLSGVGSSVSVGPQGNICTRDPWLDLVGDRPHEVGHRDNGPANHSEFVGDESRPRFASGVEPVPPVCFHGVLAEKLE